MILRAVAAAALAIWAVSAAADAPSVTERWYESTASVDSSSSAAAAAAGAAAGASPSAGAGRGGGAAGARAAPTDGEKDGPDDGGGGEVGPKDGPEDGPKDAPEDAAVEDAPKDDAVPNDAPEDGVANTHNKSRPRSSSSASSSSSPPSSSSTSSMSPEDRAAHAQFRSDRARRMAERRRRAQAKIRTKLGRPEGSGVERLSREELERIAEGGRASERARAELLEQARRKGGAAAAAAAAAADAGSDAASGAGRGGAAAADGEAGRRRRRTDAELASHPDNHQWLRRVGWGGGSSEGGIPSNYDPYGEVGPYLSDPAQDYDYWAQGYRMLGGFIDCDHSKRDDHHRRRRAAAGEGEGEGEEGDREQGDRDLSSNDGGDNFGCSRWMMWAAYVNPNYQGGGYNEYFGDGCGDDGSEPCGVLDCHESDTDWQLLGVYRQEFYQYIEQISKHLWAIDEYEYIVALAGLAYMTDYDCRVAGYDSSGNVIYTGVEPLEGGRWQMSLYSDADCLYVNDDTGYTYDDFGYASDMQLSSKDNDGSCQYDDDSCGEAYEYWQATQEYTLTNLNDVYDEYKYCTPCMDYPTYQDGYFIGDYGTDEDDLINQCWKFHSHDSFTCEAQCIALGASQDTIVSITYGDRMFGEEWEASSTTSENLAASQTTHHGSRMDRLKANLFLTFSGILFVATFLAFAVARGSGRKDRSGKSRSLLTPEERARARQRRSRSSQGRSRSSGRRSKSRSRGGGGEGGRSSSRRSDRGDRDRGDRDRDRGDRDRGDRASEDASPRRKSSSRGGARSSRSPGGDSADRERERSSSRKERGTSRSRRRRDDGGGGGGGGERERERESSGRRKSKRSSSNRDRDRDREGGGGRDRRHLDDF